MKVLLLADESVIQRWNIAEGEAIVCPVSADPAYLDVFAARIEDAAHSILEYMRDHP